MTTQSIIVYRNPMEESFWNLAMSAYMAPIYVGLFVFFVCYLTFDAITLKLQKRGIRMNREAMVMWISCWITAVTIITMYSRIL